MMLRLHLPLLSSPARPAPALALGCRVASICLLTPLVVVLGVVTLGALAVLAVTGLVRTSAAALCREDRGDLPRYARAAAEPADGVAVHLPA